MRVLTFFFTPQMSAVSRLCATRQVVCTALRWHREDAGEKVKYSTYINFSNPIWNSFSSSPDQIISLNFQTSIVFVGNAVLLPTNLWCFLGCNKYHVNTDTLIIQRTSRAYNSLYLKNDQSWNTMITFFQNKKAVLIK